MSLAQQPRREDRSEFDIRTSSDRNGYVIQPRGELDLVTNDQLHAVLTEALHSDAKRTLLDLSRVEFIDSTGIKTIILAIRTASEQRKEFRLLRGPRQVQRVFEITGIDDPLLFAD